VSTTTWWKLRAWHAPTFSSAIVKGILPRFAHLVARRFGSPSIKSVGLRRCRNRIAAPQAGEFADHPHGVQGKAPLDNKTPSSDNSQA
jgi:hypothetical protein